MMNRVVKWAVAVVILAASVSARAGEERPPNFVFILVDDLGWGALSCFGQEHWETPRLDRMAEEGMRFTDAYAGSTVCAPSRATLLTGKHTGNVFQRGNGDVQFPRDPEERTVATMLQGVGYATAMIGKSGLACHSTDAMLPHDKGFDHFFGFLSHRTAHRHYPRTLWRNGRRVELQGNDGHLGEQYADELFVDDALDWIGRNAGGPFFVHLSLTAPHADLTVPERYREPFRGRFDERASGFGGYYRQPEGLATYAGMVAFIDEAVGRVLDRVEELGVADRTLVIFASDNGPAPREGAGMEFFRSAGPFRGGKRDLYEGGIRTPQIARWPGRVPAGTSTDLLTAFWDVAPTMLDLAGLPAPDSMDGLSIAPTLMGARQDEAGRHLYWEFFEQGGKQAVRRGKWKGVRLGVDKDRNAPIELYDLESDPGETTDLSARHPGIAAELSGLMEESRTESDLFMFGTTAQE